MKPYCLFFLLIFAFHASASEGFDMLFLQEAADGNSYLYAFDFDAAEARLLLDEPMDSYDVFGHWAVYMNENRIMRLDVETGQSIVFYQCEPESFCTDAHFGANEDTILFRQIDVSDPLAEFRALYQLVLGTEAEELQTLLDTTIWLTETHLLTVYEPMGEAAQLNLYDVTTNSFQEVQIDCHICGGVSFSFASDGNRYLMATDGGLELKNMTTGETIASYPLPIEGYSLISLEDWHPDNQRIAYTSYRMDSNLGETGGSHLFLFDTSDGSSQSLWMQEEYDIFEMRWNPDGTKFTFLASSIDADWDSSENQIFLFDMATQEAQPLPLSGYDVQWLE